MFSFRQLVFLSFICIPVHSLSAMQEEENSQYSQYSQSSSNKLGSQDNRIKEIVSIENIKNKVKEIRDNGVQGENIVVALDFHGVIVDQDIHSTPLTLKDGIREMLEYFKAENVLCFVATAWDDFNAVIQEGIVKLGLQDFFDVNPNHTAELEYFKLGSKKEDLEESNVEGYRNGKVVALKYMWSTNKYFRQKAFGAELCYPEAKIHYMIFADDSKDNVDIFDEDANSITQTKGINFQELTLFYLNNHK